MSGDEARPFTDYGGTLSKADAAMMITHLESRLDALTAPGPNVATLEEIATMYDVADTCGVSKPRLASIIKSQHKGKAAGDLTSDEINDLCEYLRQLDTGDELFDSQPESSAVASGA